jgi:dihydroorotase-like cyclic amidohydrolase
VSADELEEMGPIDYLLIAWPDPHPNGEIAPLLVDLVDRGLIRILDLAFVAKSEDGTVAGLEIADLGEQVAELEVFEGASSGLLSDDDLQEAAAALEPGSAAAVLVFENRWAAPFASAVRRSGGQLVANGRIPVQAILAALDAAEKAESTTTS